MWQGTASREVLGPVIVFTGACPVLAEGGGLGRGRVH